MKTYTADPYAHSAALGHRAQNIERKRRCQECTRALKEHESRLCEGCQPGIDKPPTAATASRGGAWAWATRSGGGSYGGRGRHGCGANRYEPARPPAPPAHMRPWGRGSELGWARPAVEGGEA